MPILLTMGIYGDSSSYYHQAIFTIDMGWTTYIYIADGFSDKKPIWIYNSGRKF